MGSQKGGKFERDFCRLLSSWWSDGRDDESFFWRTSNSGGRATVRGKEGKKTRGHEGDVCFTHPSGACLLDLITFELKRGYSSYTIADLLDRPERFADQEYERWLKQAVKAHEDAGSFSWMLVVRRDQRKEFCFFPWALKQALRSEAIGAFQHESADLAPSLTLKVDVRGLRRLDICGMLLEHFFQAVGRQHVEKLARWA